MAAGKGDYRHVRRRHFTRLLATLPALPAAALGQVAGAAPKIGFIFTAPKPFANVVLEAIMSGIKASGRSRLLGRADEVIE
jgi:hypothetical protein